MSEQENRQLQSEECMAMEAIYGSDSFFELSRHSFAFTINLDQDMPDIRSPRTFTLHFHFPPTYPSQDMPIYEITSVYCGHRTVDTAMQKAIDDGFRNLFQPSEVVLFEWVQWLRDFLEEEVKLSKNMSDLLKETTDEPVVVSADSNTLPNPEQPSAQKTHNTPDRSAPSIFSSEPLLDRKSVFVAHVAAVHSVQDVEAAKATLMENKKIAKATHNILAYRILLSNDQMLQDNDDDGETAAGGRLLHLLQILDVKNVMVVVSRWYGGIQLGADRFKDINNCARHALETCGYLKNNNESNTKQHGKRKK